MLARLFKAFLKSHGQRGLWESICSHYRRRNDGENLIIENLIPYCRATFDQDIIDRMLTFEADWEKILMQFETYVKENKEAAAAINTAVQAAQPMDELGEALEGMAKMQRVAQPVIHTGPKGKEAIEEALRERVEEAKAEHAVVAEKARAARITAGKGVMEQMKDVQKQVHQPRYYDYDTYLATRGQTSGVSTGDRYNWTTSTKPYKNR